MSRLTIPRHARRTLHGLAAAAVALLLVAGPALAATPSVSIASVGGQAVNGGAVKDPGGWTIIVRRVEDGLEVARATAAVKLK